MYSTLCLKKLQIIVFSPFFAFSLAISQALVNLFESVIDVLLSQEIFLLSFENSLIIFRHLLLLRVFWLLDAKRLHVCLNISDVILETFEHSVAMRFVECQLGNIVRGPLCLHNIPAKCETPLRARC